MRGPRELPFRVETDGRTISIYAVDEAHGVSAHVMTIYPGMLVALMKGMFETHPYVINQSFKFEAHVDDEGEPK